MQNVTNWKRLCLLACGVASLMLGAAGLTGCATYDDDNRPSAVNDQPTDPDRQRVDDINRDIGRDAGLLR